MVIYIYVDNIRMKLHFEIGSVMYDSLYKNKMNLNNAGGTDMKKKFKFRYIFASSMILFGLYCVIHWYTVKDIAVDIQAKVTEISTYRETHKYGPTTTEYRIHIEYEYDGIKETTLLEDDQYEDIDARKLKKGDMVNVQINPKNPYEVFNADHTIFMGIGSLVFGGILMFIFIKMGLYEKRPLEERQAIADMVNSRELPKR